MESNCTCYETHICLVNSPCENGATCILDGDTNYTCTCTGNYTGINCTGILIVIIILYCYKLL